MFGKILEEILLEAEPSVTDITNAISNRKKVKINYNSGGKNMAKGYRVVDVYDYGISKGGNKVLRVFQEYGDSSGKNDTFTPGWKTLRVDRIEDWEETNQTFDEAPSERYGRYNPDGDNNMSVVIAKAKLPDISTDEKGNYIPAGERRYRSMAPNRGEVYNIRDLRNKYGFGNKGFEKDDSQTGKSDLTGDYWKDFEERIGKDARNVSKRDDRWKESSDTRSLSRKGSANMELVNFDNENPPFVKGKISPDRLRGTSTVNLDDDFWEQAEKEIRDMEKKSSRYGRENTRRYEHSADTRNLHRAGSANRELQDLDTDY